MASSFTVGQPFNPYKLFTGIFIPEAICKYSGLSLGAKMVYGRLCRYAGSDGKVYPSVGTVGTEISLSRKQARRYVRELEDEGLIGVQRENGKSSHYVFLWHSVFDDASVRGTPLPDASLPESGSTTDATCGSITSPGNGSQRESSERESREERTRTDTDCPTTTRKKRDSSSGQCSPAPQCKQYPKLRDLMARYLSDDPKAKPEDYPPDRMVVETMDAARIGQGYEVSEAEVMKCLVYLYNERRLTPKHKHGPRHFSWFPTVVQDYFDRAAQRAIVANPTGFNDWQERNEAREDREERQRYEGYAEGFDPTS